LDVIKKDIRNDISCIHAFSFFLISRVPMAQAAKTEKISSPNMVLKEEEKLKP
jgi:hypothetical protein